MQCNNYLVPSCCINFWPRFCIGPFLQSFPLTANTLNGVKVGTLCCVKVTPHAPWLSLVLMRASFTTRARFILALSYWEYIREDKIHWWDNLVIQYIQELCWLAEPRPDQLKQPQIVTRQFSDLNQNGDFFGGMSSVYYNGIQKSVWHSRENKIRNTKYFLWK